MKSGGVIMGLKGIDIPALSFDTTANALNGIQRDLDAQQNAMMENIRLANKAKEEERQANIQTAENTAEMKSDLKTVIHNQNDYIKMLKEQNDQIKQVLNNMFGSSEDSVIVQKEILEIMQESKPSDGLAADKGLDVVIQLAFNAIQIYMKSKGIMF